MKPIARQILEMKAFVNNENSSGYSSARSVHRPAPRPAPQAKAPAPGDFKQHPWKFRLDQPVYCRAYGNTPLFVVGGFFAGRLKFPHYVLRDSERNEVVVPQVSVSGSPFDSDRG